MTDAFLGEIRLFSYSNIPSGWLPCDGRSLTTSGNQALFALLGYQFGGSGANFNLPDLRGAAIVGALSTPGSGFPATIGSKGGKESVTLTTDQIPPHSHNLMATNTPATGIPAGGYLAQVTVQAIVPDPEPAAPPIYAPTPTNAGQLTALNSFAVGSAGGVAPHENRQPFLTMVYAICSAGVFPMRP